MPIDEVVKTFEKQITGTIVTAIYDYDANVYLVVAPSRKSYNRGEIDFNNPYYVISKKDGGISSYNPDCNMSKFTAVSRTEPLYSKGR